MSLNRSLPLLVVSLVVAGAILLLGERRSAAEDKPAHTVYLSIQGEGASAKAWYRGAPPTGMAVQDALDALSRDGYRVVTTSPSVRPGTTVVGTGSPTSSQVPEQTWVVLMERR